MPTREARILKDSRLFAELCTELLDLGHQVRFHASGHSMQPNLLDGDMVVVAPAHAHQLQPGDISLVANRDGLRVHRVVSKDRMLRSDTGLNFDPPAIRTFGKVTGRLRGRSQVKFTTLQSRFYQPLRIVLRRIRTAAALRARAASVFLFGLSVLLVAGFISTPSARAQADLTIAQTASASTIPVNTNYTYTEVATNHGPSTVPANTIVAYQQTPPNTAFRSITATNWTCTNGAGGTLATGYTGPIICTFTNALASGASANNIVITMRVNTGTATGTTILNSVSVTSQTVDPTPSNNTSVATTIVEPAASADLSLSMSASPTPVFTSSTLTYSLSVQNIGPSTAAATTNVLTDTLPTGVTFVSATGPTGWTCTGTTTVSCSSPAITAGAAPSVITIVVTAPASSTTLTNSATLSLAADQNSANDTATLITVVQPLVCATPGRDGDGGTLSGVVNTYFAPTTTGTLVPGTPPSVAIGAGTGSTVPISAGDLVLIMQMQDASINSTNTSSYGDGTVGEPATGSTSAASSGAFEFVTATNSIPITGGTLQFKGTGPNNSLLNTYAKNAATTTAGQQTYQVIRVPQYTAGILSSSLVPLAWNGSVGGVLAIDVASQLTLGGTVALDAMGFRGGGGRILTGTGTGANTDYVTLSTNLVNASKGEGIAGTPMYVAPVIITTTTTATNTGAEGLPSGSYSRGAPGNAGGGGTDGDPSTNTKNSGGGGGGNGGTGGLGGYGWNTFTALNSTDGGFGGSAFPGTTSALVMGGGGGAGTTNDGSYYISAASNGADCGATCTGIFSSGGTGGGIVIIHAGSVTGTGTITSNGQSTLNTNNDSTGGGGAGGSIEVLANSGTLSGLTVSAVGGTAGNAWPAQAPGAFSGNRHGPGGGGSGGVGIFSSTPAALNVNGGNNGYTNTAQDSYGSTPGQAGFSTTAHIITETPGTQSGAYCASADLSVTNSGAPAVVAAGGTITYSQSVVNNGSLPAVNAVLTESIPANTTFQSISVPSGWTCTTPAVGATGSISCSNPNVAASSTSNFAVAVTVNAGTTTGTQIVSVDNITSGTFDPNLANNTATATNTVGSATTANLVATNTASASVVTAGTSFTVTGGIFNNGLAAASSAHFVESIPANTTFVSLAIPAGWGCSLPPVGGTGTITCTISSLAVGGSASFPVVLSVPGATAAGTVVTATATVNSATADSNPTNNSATASVTVASTGQVDLSVATSGTPNPVTQGNNITYVQAVTNNGPIAETNATFSDTIPTNTTLVSFTPPANWTCNTIAVGATGTFTCTLNSGQTIAPGASVSFPLVVKVNTTTASGTTITNSPSVSSTVGDPNSANNTVSATDVVASPSQSDVSIVKTASPEPVDQGTNLTYSLQVTSNGPAIAQGVTVTDVLPSQVTYASVSSSQGTCTYTAATTTVSCALGSISVGGNANVTINVTANTFSSSSLSTNTATVTSTTSDPDLANNSSSATSTIQSPTAVDIAALHAFLRPDGSVSLEWRTHEESRNLGFHIYRETSLSRQRITPSLIAGSALLLRGSKPQHAAKHYRWIDAQPAAGSTYWIEDVDINGTRSLHGPVVPEASTESAAVSSSDSSTNSGAPSPLLREFRASASKVVPAMVRVSRPIPPIAPPGTPRINLADHEAVKISVNQEGWYHVSLSDLVAAGLKPGTDLRSLHLFAEGVEQPLLVVNSGSIPGPSSAIEFYGTGIDTPFSADRSYWLVSEFQSGKHILEDAPATSGSAAPSSFPFITEREDRTTYFAALLNGVNNDNFFGDTVTSDPVDQTLQVTHIDTSSTAPATLIVTLQGATDQQEHRVTVQFNGSSVGLMDFQNQTLSTQSFSVDASLLQEGVDTVTLTALNGDNDVSAVQSIQLQYAHTYAADSDWLRATVPTGTEAVFSGFSNPQIRLFDITDPLNISQLAGRVSLHGGLYDISFAISGRASSPRTILGVAADALSTPVSLAYHQPAFLEDRRAGADVVIITHPDFAADLTPLVNLREAQGHRVLMVTTDQLYDQYNFGERTPSAIRSFLNDASNHWQFKPQSVLLVGDASFDPRDYLGLGSFDFVPTRIIETAAFKTASDDWFTDFSSTGYATIPTGRLPVRTPSDTQLLVSKIVGYEQGSYAGPWNGQALLVADQNVNSNFSSAASSAAGYLPSSLQVSKILADGQDFNTVRSELLTALNNGSLLVDYQGHGAEQQWSFVDLFDSDDATALSNGGRLPIYILMDCLNGLFQDIYAQSLAESLILAPRGGAVAVWASSGFTEQSPQSSMNQALLAQFAANPGEPLGRLILQAKSGTTDADVRKTWILFGDPAMKIHMLSSGAKAISASPVPHPAAPVKSASPCGRNLCIERPYQP